MKNMIKGYTKNNVLKPQSGPISSPAFLVPKSNGKSRLVVDYRKVNIMTEDESYPIPRISDAIQRMSKCMWNSCFDLKDVFFSLPVTKETGQLSSSITDKGRYAPNRPMMGLK